jgi:hypothetical protein
MRIIFNDEPDGSQSAISLDATLDGYLHQELYWSDIIKALGGYAVRWNDAWNTPVHFETDALARKHVLENYRKHKPVSNGSKYKIDEED